MKRSEALDKIKKMLDDNMDLYAGELNISEGQILHFIENELNMLPPFVDSCPVKDPDNYVKLVVSQAAYSGQCEWDPE